MRYSRIWSGHARAACIVPPTERRLNFFDSSILPNLPLPVVGLWKQPLNKSEHSFRPELHPQYVLLGPWVESKARQEVEQEDFELHHPLGECRGNCAKITNDAGNCQRLSQNSMFLLRSGCRESPAARIQDPLRPLARRRQSPDHPLRRRLRLAQDE